MCLFKSPKPPAPPPPPPTQESKQEEELRERRKLVRRQGPFISPYATAEASYGNVTPTKTLLGA
jgi:hypothetical protein